MPVICKIGEAPRVPFKFDGRIMYSSPMVEVIHLTLKPGEQMEPHVQPFDVVFFVLEGKGVLETGDDQIVGTENTCIWMEAGKNRNWKNPEGVDLKILVFKDLK